jgi:hypothetical protein
VFDGAATHPLVLAVLDGLLGHYQLSAPTGIEIGPGETARPLHPDGGIYPIPRPHQELVVNVMWPLDDFTEANEARRIVPGSHRWGDRVPKAREASHVGRLDADLCGQPVARRWGQPHRPSPVRSDHALRGVLAAAGVWRNSARARDLAVNG